MNNEYKMNKDKLTKTIVKEKLNEIVIQVEGIYEDIPLPYEEIVHESPPEWYDEEPCDCMQTHCVCDMSDGEFEQCYEKDGNWYPGK